MSGTKLTLTEQDSGRVVVLHPGDEIEIRLSECVSGGYQWNVDSPESKILPLMDTTEGQALSDGIGGASSRTFLFRAKSPGTRHVRLEQRRSWEVDQAALKQFEVTAEVRDD